MLNLKSFLIIFASLILIKNESSGNIDLSQLYKEVDSIYMNNIITNLTLLLEGYVYLDIVKIPPNSKHQKVNLIEELKKINISSNKPFYEFFREIRRVIGLVKDVHLEIMSLNNQALNYTACIPFSFEIKTDENNEYQINMKNSSHCNFKYNNTNITDFINNAIENKTKIISINNQNAFDFFQNFGKEYFDLKNEDSRFTLMFKYIPNIPLTFLPFNESELILNIKLSNGQEESIPFFIYLSPILDFDNKNDYIKLDWNFITNGFRCRVDQKNQLNVFYQNTFLLGNDIKDIIFNCSKLFHENNYSIIGIESRNEGGMGTIATYLQQLLQPKICTNKMLFSMRKNELLKDHFETIKKTSIDFRTCKQPESYDELFLNTSDNYGENITHNRTIILDEITPDMKEDLHLKRKELLDTNNTKKPTDIIIFTDYHSISATSIFIKGFQQTGGAIIAGYFGNPKNKEGIKDASVSSSGIFNYDNSSYYKNLVLNGFLITMTGTEFYYYDYQKENPIPQEYISIPVDEQVDIYEVYNDDIYDKFINASKQIFEKYNNKCNPNNNLLLLEDPNCSNLTEHSHGGHPCGKNGEWDLEESHCQPFYCDMGYYYDTYQKKCILDICTNSNDDKDKDSDKMPPWAITLIVVIGIIVLLLALFLMKRTVTIKKSNDLIDDNGEDNKLIENN